MLPASNKGAGQSLAFPDVCNTPVGPATAPVPYPNVASNAQAASFSAFVKVSMVNALNLASTIPMTNGDQAGVAHPTVMGAATYTAGNPTVFVDRLPAISLLSPTTGNNMNAPVGAVLVPSAVNVFYSCAIPEPASVSGAILALEAAAVDCAYVAPGIAWVRIEAFAPDASRRFAVATRALTGTDAIILDLRGNRGGSLSAALDLAADLVPKGTVVAELEDGDGDVETVVTSRDPRLSGPIVVLVDRATASAAEALVRALKTAGNALVVGEPTFGKDYATVLEHDAEGRHVLRPALSCAPADARGPIVPHVLLDPVAARDLVVDLAAALRPDA